MATDANRPARMTELAWMGAAALSAAYAKRDLSPVEVVTALFDRIERLDGEINAFILPDRDGAMAAARAAEAEIMAGRNRGPLHGVPFGVKDIIDVAGLPTTCHSKILLGNVATADAVAVGKLRGAGAIPMGKLSTHEFAIGGPAFDLPFKPARNPWNRDHHPGGSSSGSGAGLAAGFFPLALGTDTGGSVRNPASACGIVGLKPTYGLVSRRGVFPLSYTLDHVGPMARDAEDAALLLDVLAGFDPADPGSAPAPAVHAAARTGDGVAGLRVGYVRHFHERDAIAHEDVAEALNAVAAALTGLGAVVRDITLPPLAEFTAVNRTILAAESWSIHAPWLRSRPGDYAAMTRSRLLTGAFISAGDYVGAQRARLAQIRAVNDAFRDVDVLLCASSLDPACRIDDPAEVARTYSRQCRMPFNVTGHPALAMMAGLSRDGLPVSMQLAGPFHADALLLRVAAAYEKTAPWRGKRPNLPA